MNMIKLEDMLLCTHFIMLKEKIDSHAPVNSPVYSSPIFIKGPVLVNLEKGSVNEVESFIVS